MGWCWRWSPLVAVVALLIHAVSWLGSDTARPSASSPAPTNGMLASLTGLSGVNSMAADISGVISQSFAWLFLLIAVNVVWGTISLVVKEIKLRRMYDRRGRRMVPPPGPAHPSAESGHPL